MPVAVRATVVLGVKILSLGVMPAWSNSPDGAAVETARREVEITRSPPPAGVLRIAMSDSPSRWDTNSDDPPSSSSRA